MGSITIHLCGNCEYYQEPHNDYPERGICECMNCTDWFCDECQSDHAVGCVSKKDIKEFTAEYGYTSKDDLKDFAIECCFG